MKNKYKIKRLEKAVVDMFEMISNLIRPECSWVNEWYVEDEWKELNELIKEIK